MMLKLVWIRSEKALLTWVYISLRWLVLSSRIIWDTKRRYGSPTPTTAIRQPKMIAAATNRFFIGAVPFLFHSADDAPPAGCACRIVGHPSTAYGVGSESPP